MSQSLNNQKGAALVVSMVILVAMTLLGITSMKSATTEFTMVGNLRESAMTFQAAELGLVTAENILEAGGTPANMIAENAAEPDYLQTASWTGASVTTVSGISMANIPSENFPRYIIKDLGRWGSDTNVTSIDPGFGGEGTTSTAKRVDYFRVSSRGFGQTGNTSRTLQSFFARRVN